MAPTISTTVGRFINHGEDMFAISNPAGTVELRYDGNADLHTTGDADQFNGLPLVSHGFVSQVATYDSPAGGLGAALSGQLLYTTPLNEGASATDPNNTYTGFYRCTYLAKVIQAASSSSTLGGTGGITFSFTSADDGNVLSSIPGVLNGNVGHNDLTTTWGSGQMIIYAEVGTNITFSFGYLSSGATPMLYSLHIRLEDM